MAKQVKKKQDTTANPRSRAAKRATSPSINVDKSIKDTPRAAGTSPMLGISRNSGVSKKKKVKHMTRGQRVRQEKGLARAEAVMDQMERKVDDAKTKLKKRNMRKALWEEVNDVTADETRKAVKGPGRELIPGEDDHQSVEGDAEMGSAGLTVPTMSTTTTAMPSAITEETAAAADSNHDGEVDLIT